LEVEPVFSTQLFKGRALAEGVRAKGYMQKKQKVADSRFSQEECSDARAHHWIARQGDVSE
jgi:hypothetical protein